MSVAWRESLFDRTATSRAGARGLMQLMPKTAAQLAGSPVSEAEISSAGRNVRLGARYLADLLERYDGRIVPALAAYNAGPKNAAKWLARSEGWEGDEFVERISFRETREYVKAVLRNYRAYRQLYPRESDRTSKLRLY